MSFTSRFDTCSYLTYTNSISLLEGTYGFPDFYIKFDTVEQYIKEVFYWKFKTKNCKIESTGSVTVGNISVLGGGSIDFPEDLPEIDWSIRVLHSDGASSDLSYPPEGGSKLSPEERLDDGSFPKNTSQLVCSSPNPFSFSIPLSVSVNYVDWSGYTPTFNYGEDIVTGHGSGTIDLTDSWYYYNTAFSIYGGTEFGCAPSKDNSFVDIDPSTNKINSVYVKLSCLDLNPSYSYDSSANEGYGGWVFNGYDPQLSPVANVSVAGVGVDIKLDAEDDTWTQVGTYKINTFTKNSPQSFTMYAKYPDYSEAKSTLVPDWAYWEGISGKSIYDASTYFYSTGGTYSEFDDLLGNQILINIVDYWDISLDINISPATSDPDLWTYQ